MKFSKEHSLIVKGVLIIFMLTHHLFLNTAVYESQQLITLIHNLDNWENYVIFFKICVSGFVFISAYGIAEQISGLYSRDVETSSKKMLGYAIGRWQHLWFSFVFIYILAILYTRFFTSSSITRLYSNEDGEYSCAMKSQFRKIGNQMSGTGNHPLFCASLLAHVFI